MPDEIHDGDAIDGGRAELEARFRELEAEEEVERLRSEAGRPPAGGPGARSRPGAASTEEDPLAQMKAAFDSDAAAASRAARYVLVLCPHCEAKNRTSLTRLRAAHPICGACGRSLGFARK